ncbi:MAG TPA: D-alanyl-D-alanine carboxypeptidase family protein [Acidimicrobiia bacterium]|nr:D-alanyl-D-alanine carboxypeptidase family protein [Acidimicrobiia bacterium]
MKRRVLVLVAAFAVVLAPAGRVAAGPVPVPTRPLEGLATLSPPEITAEAWLLWDDTFERELGSLNPDQARAMASTTKMMTALVALRNSRPDDPVLISETAASIGESEIDLVPGESWRMEDLLRALLMRSANDAAIAIAEQVGGSEAGFVRMMNEMAVDMGLENSHFMNPHGLDAEGHFSSARDLLTTALIGMDNPTFAEIVRTRSSTFPDSPSGEERVASTTNALLSTFDGAIGVKTGYTDDAGLTMVAAAERDGRRLYAVVMGSTNHFADAAALLRYGFSAFGLLNVVAEGQVMAAQRGPAGTTDALAQDDLDIFAATEQVEEIDIAIEYSATGGPEVVVEAGEEEIGRIGLELAEPSPLPGLADALSWASAYWDWLWGND